jgi:hypothetical protein
VRRLPGPAGDELGEGYNLPRLPSVCFGTGREHKLKFLCGLFGVSNSKWISGSAESRNHQPRGTVAQPADSDQTDSAVSRARPEILCFSLDNDLNGCQLEEYQIETASLAIFANFLLFDDTFIVVEK